MWEENGIVIGHLIMGSGVSVPEPMTLNGGNGGGEGTESLCSDHDDVVVLLLVVPVSSTRHGASHSEDTLHAGMCFFFFFLIFSIHDGCAEQTSCPFLTMTSLADELI